VGKEKIILEMTSDEAEALAYAIYLIGEHISAGAPIPTDDYTFNARVGAVYGRLKAAIK
jgi:hypothetical protein